MKASDSGPIAIIGGGTIGASLAALFTAHGMAVRVYDADPRAGKFLHGVVDTAYRDLLALGVEGPRGPLDLEATLPGACTGARLVVEAVKERLDVKRGVLADCEQAVAPETVIATTTSSLLPSD